MIARGDAAVLGQSHGFDDGLLEDEDFGASCLC